MNWHFFAAETGGASAGTEAVDLAPLATKLGRPLAHVRAAVALLDAGNTIPFVARYRKEQTGGMDDEQLRRLFDELTQARALAERRAEVLRLLAEQEQLTPTLEKQVRAASTRTELDDLYRPFRPRRTTRASVARDNGLEPLAGLLLARDGRRPEVEAATFVTEKVADAEAALQGARDIVAELLSDDADLRARVRRFVRETGSLQTTLRDDEGARDYEAYADYAEPIRRIPPHRVLAINRGEREDALRVSLQVDADRLNEMVAHVALYGSLPGGRSAHSVKNGAQKRERNSSRSATPADEHLRAAAHDSVRRLILPSIEREVRNELTAAAAEQALKVFRENLRSLLLQPPLQGQVVIGLDPAFRTGVKVAVVDATGRLLATDVIYPTAPHHRTEAAGRRLTELTEQFGVTAIAIGNGTASRETESFVANWLQQLPDDERPAYAIIDEAGASVYSASPGARKEFPDLDASERSAVSIARRLQDPLAELVKIEPRSLGVGQYQHDMDQRRLGEQLAGVVEASVNEIGVDLNTASVELLSYVAGVAPRVAANIVAHREDAGPFQNRRQLLDVSRLGPRTFEQCAGFLQIPGADDPLDRTPIHPESYDVARRLLASLGVELHDVVAESDDGTPVSRALSGLTDDRLAALAAELDCGEPTLRDIVAALRRPGRDPRADLPPPVLRSDILDLDDLEEGMVLSGTVRNVVDFGAFVDIGVTEDGLVHISELADRYVKHPLDVVAVGDTVQVRILRVDKERRRIGLSMKGT